MALTVCPNRRVSSMPLIGGRIRLTRALCLSFLWIRRYSGHVQCRSEFGPNALDGRVVRRHVLASFRTLGLAYSTLHPSIRLHISAQPFGRHAGHVQPIRSLCQQQPGDVRQCATVWPPRQHGPIYAFRRQSRIRRSLQQLHGHEQTLWRIQWWIRRASRRLSIQSEHEWIRSIEPARIATTEDRVIRPGKGGTQCRAQSLVEVVLE